MKSVIAKPKQHLPTYLFKMDAHQSTFPLGGTHMAQTTFKFTIMVSKISRLTGCTFLKCT
ncbi:hypothetical protein CI610_03615 [invertebrate metagenome]|uniref:Uncharacterized protein n=1 Tax=invertebrate metagenome TaxID=1711999 RepID=A0A2H9T2L0_9ZZZZ